MRGLEYICPFTHKNMLHTCKQEGEASATQLELINSKLWHNVHFLPRLRLDLKLSDLSVCRPDPRVLIETNARSSFLPMPHHTHPLWKPYCVTRLCRKIQEIPTVSCAISALQVSASTQHIKQSMITKTPPELVCKNAL